MGGGPGLWTACSRALAPAHPRRVVLTYAQLLGRLGSRQALALALRDGTWTRVLRDAYVRGPVDLAARARAAALVLPPGAAVAGTSALWLHGVDLRSPALLLQVVVPRGVQPPRRAGLVARQAALPPEDVRVVDGVRVLHPARAAADLMRTGPLLEAVVVADACLHARLATRDALAQRLDAAAGRRGVVVAREACALADARAESPQESRLRVPLVLAGLPVVPQWEVRDPRGVVVARVDLALPHLRLALEYDGRDAHGPEAFVRDRQRQNALVALGWTVLRVTAADLRDPRRLLAQLRALTAA